ncbi:prefoldin subunit alpha [Methanolobus chelungpuianus]|uniref:Prefoldin subunit alpha n=1 Tax=Methanolobus chelungpuianus TaxID=502115 RepID=A0AAE3HC54_9EURY|nr:prefoldin subunit alpha [Methanolobus chelungpuianus]MCQ6963378.1 prefoldin subunit alpha [Methanolobus chelungpuianus]
MSGVNEQDPRALVMQHRELQKRAELLQQQMTMIRMSADESAKALNTIEELSNVKEGTEMMFPIGSGSFVYANIARVDNIVVDVGAGISVERSLSEAKEIMEHRKERLEKAFENMSASLSKIGQQMQAIEAFISRQQQAQEQAQVPR